MVPTEIKELLAERLGFDVETIGPKAVATMITRAMENDGFSDPSAYACVLRHEQHVWDRFVDQVVVPETWFFRDVAPFEFAADLIRTYLHPNSTRSIRILSCPCSTGEEPYSLVLSMLHAGAPPNSFRVDAVDVSHRSLEIARAAVFNTHSFRGEFPSDLESYFDRSESDGARRLNASARACVRFRQGNIIAPDFLMDEAPYDLVFCRNLLIYLHLEARLLAMSALRRLVAAGGVLVLGHAETTFAREHGFRPTGPTGAFAFLKSNERFTPKSEPPPSQPPRRRVPAEYVSVSPVAPKIASPAPIATTTKSAEPSKASVQSMLAMASELGDAGQLHSALQVCSEYLRHVPDSAKGYFLLGVLHDALGHLELAMNSFRKVLYLDPNHQEALLCLALKQEACGNIAGAALLRNRARRVQQTDNE